MAEKRDENRDSNIIRHGTLEIEENMEAQKRLWKIQHFGRTLGLIVILLSMAGLLARGPLTKVTKAEGPLTVEYERVAHRFAHSSLSIKMQNQNIEGEKARIWLDNEYLSGARIEGIDPEPSETIVGAEKTYFVFDLKKEPGTSRIAFELEPSEFGKRQAKIGIENGPSLEFS